MSFVRFAVYDRAHGLYLKETRGRFRSSPKPDSSVLFKHAVDADHFIRASCKNGEVHRFAYVPVQSFLFDDPIPLTFEGYSLAHVYDGEEYFLSQYSKNTYPTFYEFLAHVEKLGFAPSILKTEFNAAYFKSLKDVRQFQDERKKALDAVSFTQYKKDFVPGYSDIFIKICKAQFNPENLRILGLKLESY